MRALAKVITQLMLDTPNFPDCLLLACKEIRWHLAKGTLPLVYLSKAPLALIVEDEDTPWLVSKMRFWRSFLVDVKDLKPEYG